MGSLRIAIRGLGFAKIAILARLLTPDKFGVFGIASLVLTFLETITETGINIFLIQERADMKKYVDSSFVVSIARGFLISVLLFLLSPLIADFFSSPDVLPLLYLTSLIPLVRGFINPSIVRYQKDLQFNKEFFFRTFLYVVDVGVAIGVAYATRSAVSLVWGMIAGGATEVIFSHLLVKPRPKIKFEMDKLKKIVSQGKWVTLARIFDYLFREGDDVVVGKMLNTTALGLYQVAYKISTLPITEITDVVIKVTFPVFSQMTKDHDRLKKAFTKAFVMVTILVLPFSFGIYYFADSIVGILLGAGWEEVIPILKILSVFGAIRAIVATSYPLLLALKKQKQVSTITLFAISGLAVSIFPLVGSYGVVGAAYAAIIGALISIPVAVYFTNKALKI